MGIILRLHSGYEYGYWALDGVELYGQDATYTLDAQSELLFSGRRRLKPGTCIYRIVLEEDDQH